MQKRKRFFGVISLIAILLFFAVVVALWSEVAIAAERTPPAPPVRLFPGRTLVAPPFETIDKMSFSNCEKITRVSRYDNELEGYKSIDGLDSMASGLGYNVVMDSEKECAIYFEGKGKVTLNTLKQVYGGTLFAGRNQISGTTDTIDLSLPENRGSCNNEITRIATYVPEIEGYASVTKLEMGKSYIVYVKNDCSLGN